MMISSNIVLLQRKVEATLGKKIFSFKECIELHNDILKKTGLFIGVQTLRRFFGLVKAPHAPSFTTLNILSTYCGYASVEDLTVEDVGASSDEKNNPALLNYLINLFKHTVVRTDSEATYANIVRHTIYFLEQEPNLIEPFQREIAKTKNGQEFYFERFINIDKLNGYYGNGLRFYLQENKNAEAQIFGNAALALRHWLASEDNYFQLYAQRATGHSIETSVHPFVIGRYFGTRFLQANVAGSHPSPLHKEARDFYFQHKRPKKEKQRFPSFETTITLLLVLTEEWDEAMFYANCGLDQYRGSASANAKQVYQSFLLYKAMALAYTGNTAEASRLYDKIDTTDFYFLSKKLLCILHTKLGSDLKKIRSDDAQLTHLISETGFVRLLPQKKQTI